MADADQQDTYDDAILAYTQGDYDGAIAQLEAILADDPWSVSFSANVPAS